MIIRVSEDIEDICREALSPYLPAYCPPLPAEFPLPCVLVRQAGGSVRDTIDTFTVTVDARAETEAEAMTTLRAAIGVLQAVADAQTTPIRVVGIKSSGSWGQDPVRPELAMCSATLRITAHQTTMEVNTNGI